MRHSLYVSVGWVARSARPDAVPGSNARETGKAGGDHRSQKYGCLYLYGNMMSSVFFCRFSLRGGFKSTVLYKSTNCLKHFHYWWLASCEDLQQVGSREPYLFLLQTAFSNYTEGARTRGKSRISSASSWRRCGACGSGLGDEARRNLEQTGAGAGPCSQMAGNNGYARSLYRQLRR